MFTKNMKQELPKLHMDRQKLVQDKCEEYHDEIVASYKQYLPSENYKNVVTKLLSKAKILHSTNDIPFLWCRIPKVASQSWGDLFMNVW